MLIQCSQPASQFSWLFDCLVKHISQPLFCHARIEPSCLFTNSVESKYKLWRNRVKTQDLLIWLTYTLTLGSLTIYCLNTISQKLHFSKSHFSEPLQEKYDHAIFLQLMSPKKCHKKFENRFTNKIIML